MIPLNRFSLIFVASVFVLQSCRKELDMPPANSISDGQKLTVTELRELYNGNPIHFEKGDSNLYCVVTADEVSGNLYKNIFVTDRISGLNVRLIASGGLYQGDSIRINLNGTVLSEYNGMLQLDSVDVDKNVVKLAAGLSVSPKKVTMAEVMAGSFFQQVNDTLLQIPLQGMLIQLDSVEFSPSDVGTTFALPTTLESKNTYLLDCNGNSLLVRSSGYANFAGSLVPRGNGTVIGALGQYFDDKQLYLRTLNDVQVSGTPCILVMKDFEDEDISSGGWVMKLVSGNVNWTTNTQGAVYGAAYGQVSNYINGANVACESWLISPALDLTGSENPIFSFVNAKNYSGDILTVWVSTDYDGVSVPASATWTQLQATLSSGSWNWVSSGDISLSSYKSSSNVRVAFKYTGSSSSGSTWEIDNIAINDF